MVFRDVALTFGTKIAPEVIAFETKALPWTAKVAPPATGVVPIPRLAVAVRDSTLSNVMFAVVVMMFWVTMAFDA
jgi:hypothetical protein